MSQHHRAQQWSTHSPKLRTKIARMLPQPCVDCGQPVLPGQPFQVGHRHAAAHGGRPTLANSGPSHVKSDTWPRNCNQIAGGRMGARVTNSRRQARKDIREW